MRKKTLRVVFSKGGGICDSPTHGSLIKYLVNNIVICEKLKRGVSQRDIDSRAREEDFLGC